MSATARELIEILSRLDPNRRIGITMPDGGYGKLVLVDTMEDGYGFVWEDDPALDEVS